MRQQLQYTLNTIRMTIVGDLCIYLVNRPNFLSKSSFLLLQHEALLCGRFVTRYPNGHICLLFWKQDTNNPSGIETVQQLKDLLKDSVTGKE